MLYFYAGFDVVDFSNWSWSRILLVSITNEPFARLLDSLLIFSVPGRRGWVVNFRGRMWCERMWLFEKYPGGWLEEVVRGMVFKIRFICVFWFNIWGLVWLCGRGDKMWNFISLSCGDWVRLSIMVILYLGIFRIFRH